MIDSDQWTVRGSDFCDAQVQAIKSIVPSTFSLFLVGSDRGTFIKIVKSQDGRNLDPGVTKESCKDLLDRQWPLSKNQMFFMLSH